MDIEFHIYLATKTRRVHLTKSISMPVVPRVGECVKFQNAVVGDYFPFVVSNITYREFGHIEILTELLDNIDDRGYSFEEETDLDEYLESYLSEGWHSERGIKPNTRFAQLQESDLSGA